MHVLIAGVAGITGRLLAETLLAETLPATPEIVRVTGLDPRPCQPPIEGLRFVRARFRQPEWTPLLDDVDAAIHVMGVAWPALRHAMIADETLFEDTRFFIDAALAAGVRKLIIVTSAALYGAQRDRVDESAPVRGHAASAYARARARVSDYLDVIAARADQTQITRLRVAMICGARHTALARHAQTEPLVVRGFTDRTLDVVHDEDVMAAIRLALHENVSGVYNVSAGDTIRFRDLALLARQDYESGSFLRMMVRAWWRWRWRGQPTPPRWVGSLYRAGSLDTGRLRAVGWSPQFTAQEAVCEALQARDSDV